MTEPPGPALRAVPALTGAVLALGVGAGLAGVLLPAFGWWPVLGRETLSLAAFTEAMAWPGFWRAAVLGLWTGLAATALSVALTVLIVAGWHGTPAFAVVTRALAPLLAVPHAAAAFGLAFLIAPSGWIARMLSPDVTGWTVPPDLLVVNDHWGLSLIAGLVVKEVPFLLLMTLAGLAQVDGARSLAAAQSLGAGRVTGWCLAVLPQIWPSLRLPVLAVLAYSVGVVDVALILGPTRPAPLAVLVVDWANDPDLALRFRAAAGAVMLLALAGVAVALALLAEAAAVRLGRRMVWRGARGGAADPVWRALGAAAAAGSVAAVALGLAAMAVWSVAALWPFPDAWPEALTGRTWAGQAGALAPALWQTLALAGLSVAGALAAVVLMLEAEHRRGRPLRVGPLIWAPLLVPQVAFLPGVQALALLAGAEGGLLLVAAVHGLFVLPYVWLVLAGPWRAWDRRAGVAAASVGAGPWRILWAVRLPMLLRPVAAAAAVGVAVSVAQYLPTLLAGGGRIVTLTSEAVALSSGGNRRVIGVWAFAQAAVPLAAFGLALAVPVLLHRNRRGLWP